MHLEVPKPQWSKNANVQLSAKQTEKPVKTSKHFFSFSVLPPKYFSFLADLKYLILALPPSRFGNPKRFIEFNPKVRR